MPRRALTALLLIASLPAAAAETRPVVVELFTSQGCSSCPPADAFLTELAGRPDVLPLAFHVTYWDQLGWKDPYGLAASTERQARYAQRFGASSYTPEMVVAGRTGLVGSDRAEAEATIAAARANQSDTPELRLTRRETRLRIEVGAGRGTAQIVLVGFDPRHRTMVGRGENGGRTLTESNIVRALRTVGRWTGQHLVLSVDMPASQTAAVLLESVDGGILGAARLEPAS